jgi:hypothetical protein
MAYTDEKYVVPKLEKQQGNDDCPVECPFRFDTDNQLIASIRSRFARCLSIAAAKNADYAASPDPFRNFRRAEMVGVSVERGILVRLTDKLCRVSNLLDADAEVKDERVTDTIDDAINYLAILGAWLERER